MSHGEKIVCAANRHKTTKTVILGLRHWDIFMRQAKTRVDNELGRTTNSTQWEHGFVDNKGQFLTRNEACMVAKDNGQFNRYYTTNQKDVLFSEDLY